MTITLQLILIYVQIGMILMQILIYSDKMPVHKTFKGVCLTALVWPYSFTKHYWLSGEQQYVRFKTTK